MQLRLIGEGVVCGIVLHKKIEGIDNGKIRGQVDRDGKFGSRRLKHQPRQPVAMRVLLPVDKMVGGLHLQRIAGNFGAAMRRWPQTDNLRPQNHRPVIDITCLMMKCRKNGHLNLWVRGTNITISLYGQVKQILCR